MATFVDAFGNQCLGYPKINLDRVSVMRQVKENGKVVAYDCENARGVTIGRVASYHVPSEDAPPATIVPETRGTFVIRYWGFEGKLFTQRFPVIAWKVCGSFVDAITCEMDSFSSEVLELQENGKPYLWIRPGDDSFDSLESVMECLAAEVANEHAKKQKKQESTSTSV